MLNPSNRHPCDTCHTFEQCWMNNDTPCNMYMVALRDEAATDDRARRRLMLYEVYYRWA